MGQRMSLASPGVGEGGTKGCGEIWRAGPHLKEAGVEVCERCWLLVATALVSLQRNVWCGPGITVVSWASSGKEVETVRSNPKVMDPITVT